MDVNMTAPSPEEPPKIRFNRDPVSWMTHFAGALVGAFGLAALIYYARHDVPRLVSMAIYGMSLVALFSASTAYHFFDLGPRGNKWLRRVDHAAIYLLIAGTYVPALTLLLSGTMRVAMLAIVLGIAMLGVLFKLVLFNAAGKAGTILYVILGWVIVIPGYYMLPRMSAESVTWLVSGGIAYTVGALIYATKRPDPWPGVFGFHEVWHLFVLLGATLHYLFTFSLLDVAYAPF